MQLSVIIVSYNVKYFLEQCLCAVQQALKGIKAEVFIIDNCSTDGSVEYLQQKYSWADFIINEKNEGFARANNIALNKCRGEIVLFLNPDTIIPENILTEALAFFKTNADAGAAGVRMLDGRGVFLPESKRAFPAPLVSFCKLSGLSALFPKSSFFNRYALGNLAADAIHEVDVLCGAFMMVRRDLLLQLNGFDEKFFMYGEDIDLSCRIQMTGKKNYYLGNLAIVHFKGESAGHNKSAHTRIFYKAMNVFVKKYYTGLRGLLLKTLLRTGIYIRAAISFLSVPLRIFMNDIKDALQVKQRNIYLIGDISSTAEAEKIMLKHKLQKSFRGSLLIEKKEAFVATTGSDIIFCTGILSFRETINIISKYPKKNNYMWHGLYTGSIVCSTNKKESGIGYSIEMHSSETKNAVPGYNFIQDDRYKFAGNDKNVSRKFSGSDTTPV